MKLAVPPQIHWISSYALLLNKAFVTVGSYSAHHAQVGGTRIVKQLAYSKHCISLKDKCTNFKASAIIAPPTATYATLPALIARELEIVRGGLSGGWVTLVAAHKSNTSTNIYKTKVTKNKASELF